MVRNRLKAFLILVAVTVSLTRSAGAQALSSDPSDVLFDDSVVHEIRLAINSRDWQSLKDHYLENDYYPCDFRWRDQTVRNIGIRSRGTGSRSGTKPGLRVDFDRNVTDQKFLGLKSLILRNNTQDPSNMREIISMKFFRRMGIAASRESFTRLYVNNEYVGLYTIVESVDKTFLKKNLGEDEGYLYKYEFDREVIVPYDFGYRGSDPELYVPDPFKPETHEAAPRAEVVEQFIWTVSEAPAASWRQRMDEFLDLSKFMRQLGIENFLAEEDGLTGDYGPNNFYIYRYDGKNLFRFVPWDKSNTFWESPGYWIFRNIKDGPDDHRNRLVLRALQYDDLRDEYLNTLLACADSAVEDGWLEQEVSAQYDRIRSAARSDTFKPFSNDQFEGAIEDLKTFARNRSDSVRNMVATERPQ